ncbi:MAG TPA: hypothetical protein VHF89_03405 [Solirubrobacteraceae bacterium]|nr:hypothetical protein [Solirubrobacteraceae bacterium]
MSTPARTVEELRRSAPAAPPAHAPTAGAAPAPDPGRLAARQLGNSVVAARDGAPVPQPGPPAAPPIAAARTGRERAHRLVAAVDDLLAAHTRDAGTRASGWGEAESAYAIDLRCREASDAVRRLEVALRVGDPIPESRWRSAAGAMRMAQRYLERLVEPNGRERVQAAVAALERAALLVPAPPAPRPLARGWHLIVDEAGDLLGYAEVVDASYTRFYDRKLDYVDGVEVPIRSEGLGPLDYLLPAAGAARAAYRITGGLAARLGRSFAAPAVKRAAARSVLVAGVMRGVADAAPVVAGRMAGHAFILSETLAGEVAVAEAAAAARPAAAAAAELEAAGAGARATQELSIGAQAARPGGTAAPAAGGAVAPATVGAGTAAVARHLASLGEQAEGPNLRRYHPDALSVPPKFRAYDAYEGGTVESHLTRERTKAGWALVVNQVVSDARWISLKQVLDPQDATPANIARHVDKALRDMERDANDRTGRLPSRDPEPIEEGTYLRVVKQRPKRVTLHITYPGPLPASVEREIEAAAREAALRSGRLGDLPPFDLLLNGRDVPLR